MEPEEDPADVADGDQSADNDKPDPNPNAELVEPDDGDSEDEPDDLDIGEAFALAGVAGETHNAQFLEANEANGIPGCYASLLCSCGQPFKLNLVKNPGEQPECCPGCQTEYTSALVIGAVDDGEIWPHAMEHVFRVNGVGPDPDDNEDENEDEDEDEDEDESPTEIPDAVTKA